MFAHVHATGKGYFAHGGAWIPLANESQIANVSNWDTAYGWGNHASAGYLTSLTLNDLTDVDATTGAAVGKILKYNGASWELADDLSSSGGIALTDLSVTTASAGTAALSYNSGTGAFTYTPPDLSGYLTSSSTLNGANVNAMRDFTGEHIASSTLSQRVFQDGAVTYAKMQNVSATDRILGRDSAGAGDVEEITPASLRTMLNVADGANAITNNNQISNGAGYTTYTSNQATNTNSAVTFASVYASGNVTAYSDVSLKENIHTISDALSKVTKLRGVSYVRKDTKQKSIGVIAQEIEKVLPEVVETTEYKSVAYGNIVGLLIESIKELKTEVDDLKKQLRGDK